MAADPNDPIWYFAYGSNMSPAIFLERRRMQPLMTQRGRLHDYRLCFNLPVGPGERGVANIEPHAGAAIWGVLYLLTSAEIDRLDRTEGVPQGVYARISVEVAIEAGERLAAYTYRSAIVTAGRKPSARYMGLILEGASQHGLPADYVRFLEGFELAWDERLGEGGSRSRSR